MYCLCALIISILELLSLFKSKRKMLFVIYIVILIIGAIFYYYRNYIPSFAEVVLRLMGDNNG